MLNKYVVSLVLLALGAFTFFAWWSGEQDWKRMEKEIAAARASIAALPSGRRVLRGKAIEGDAREAYHRAFELLLETFPRSGGGASEEKHPGAFGDYGLRPAKRGALHPDQEALLRKLEPFFAQLDRACRSKTTAPRDWKGATPAKSEELFRAYEFGMTLTLLHWQIQQACAAAEPKLACDRILDALRIAADVGAEGSFLHHMLAASYVYTLAELAFDLEAAEEDEELEARPAILDFAKWPASERQRLDAALARLDAPGMSIEHLGLSETLYFHELAERGAPHRNTVITSPHYLFSGTALYADAILSRLEHARACGRVEGDFRARKKALETLDAEASAAAKHSGNPITMIAIQGASPMLLSSEAERRFALRALRLAIAQASGSEVSLEDPFGSDGAKLTVTKHGAGFEIRSAGTRRGRPLRLARK